MNKKKSKRQNIRKLRTTDKIGIAFVWLFLIILWATCIVNIVNENYFGYKNYFGQPVGTYLLLSILIIATPICIIMTFKTIKNKSVETPSVPEWMNKPPWRLPWE